VPPEPHWVTAPALTKWCGSLRLRLRNTYYNICLHFFIPSYRNFSGFGSTVPVFKSFEFFRIRILNTVKNLTKIFTLWNKTVWISAKRNKTRWNFAKRYETRWNVAKRYESRGNLAKRNEILLLTKRNEISRNILIRETCEISWNWWWISFSFVFHETKRTCEIGNPMWGSSFW
jgi:hypothetical protein